MTTSIEDQTDDIRKQIGKKLGPLIYGFYGKEIPDRKWMDFMGEVKTEVLTLFAHLASEAKPEKPDKKDFEYLGCRKHWSDDSSSQCNCSENLEAAHVGFNLGIDIYEANLLRAITGEQG